MPSELFCWYGIVENEQIILKFDEDRKVQEVFRSKSLPWPWGTPHGGAICEGQNGNLLHFFNSHTAHRDRTLDRYMVGVAELAGEPPFEMLRISKRPVLVGEEGVNLDKTTHFKSNVVFACGAMKTGDQEWLLSFGRNDHQCCLIKLGVADLKL